MWRRQRAAVRSSQREGAFPETVVVAVVVVVLRPVVGLGLVVLSVEAGAAAAAVVRPANASRSPQARIERRKSFPSWVDCKSEAEWAGRRLWGEHRSARLMRSVARG
jgi:hypothetical protein